LTPHPAGYSKPPVSDPSEAGAPDKWILPDGLDPDRVEKAVEVVVNWEEDGAESAVDLVLRLYPIFCSRTSQADSSLSHEEKT
jgi:hypothetical protein